MGIFNKNIFNELESGFKNLANKVKENFNNSDEKKDVVEKCPNCGATTVNGVCDYCGKAKIKNNETNFANAETIKYPVLVFYEEDAESGFFAYDEQTDTSTYCHKTVANALAEIQNDLQKFLNDGYTLKFWTETEFMSKKYVIKQLKKGAKVKYIELDYVDPKKDPDW